MSYRCQPVSQTSTDFKITDEFDREIALCTDVVSAELVTHALMAYVKNAPQQDPRQYNLHGL